jgi:hypothetical protein
MTDTYIFQNAAIMFQFLCYCYFSHIGSCLFNCNGVSNIHLDLCTAALNLNESGSLGHLGSYKIWNFGTWPPGLVLQ